MYRGTEKMDGQNTELFSSETVPSRTDDISSGFVFCQNVFLTWCTPHPLLFRTFLLVCSVRQPRWEIRNLNVPQESDVKVWNDF
ncbi:hypothetical protein CEXT_790971 [Caerostris extrusa]|uniref:Uncharacterized protein n=1 Tax=Caerostris extrusa TaxID=172846 RepID=A0AAV4V2S4_CAEEX|nr:hypothetical protein CEXT_790971 [Caerostris extrusa]